MRGLIHIYTGDGKGKTTAALGLSLRAYGRGRRVALIQFLKGRETGELAVLRQLGAGYQIRRHPELTKFVKDLNPVERAAAAATVNELWNSAQTLAADGACELLILDEVMAAIATGLLPLAAVVAWLREKPAAMEVVLTGRRAPAELLELADYVSEIQAVKHPFERGIGAREGIEY